MSIDEEGLRALAETVSDKNRRFVMLTPDVYESAGVLARACLAMLADRALTREKLVWLGNLEQLYQVQEKILQASAMVVSAVAAERDELRRQVEAMRGVLRNALFVIEGYEDDYVRNGRSVFMPNAATLRGRVEGGK